jgi:hypothetical protein
MTFSLASVGTPLLAGAPRTVVRAAGTEWLWDDRTGRPVAIDPNVGEGTFRFLVCEQLFRLVSEECAAQLPACTGVCEARLHQACRSLFGDARVADRLLITLAQALPDGVQPQAQGLLWAGLQRLLEARDAQAAAWRMLPQPLRDHPSRLAARLTSPDGLLAVASELWVLRQRQLARRVLTVLERGEAYGPFSARSLRDALHYLEAYYDALQLADAPSTVITDFAVTTEAAFSFCLGALDERASPQRSYQVWLDVWKQAALSVRTPLLVQCALLSCDHHEALRQLLQQGEVVRVGTRWCLARAGRAFPRLTYEEGSAAAELHLRADLVVPLTDVRAPGEVLTGWHHPRGTLLEQLDVSRLPDGVLTGHSFRCTLWDGIFNAKAVYQEFLGHAGRVPVPLGSVLRPATTVPTSDRSFICKEGGAISCGGKGVHVVQCVADVPRDTYQVCLLQEAVPSLLAETLTGQPLHGHIRCLASLDRYGREALAGYGVRLALPTVAGQAGSSSAFRSVRLLFDATGSFVYGWCLRDGAELVATTLAELGVRLRFPDDVFRQMLEACREAWRLSLVQMNAAANRDAPTLAQLLRSDLLGPTLRHNLSHALYALLSPSPSHHVAPLTR